MFRVLRVCCSRAFCAWALALSPGRAAENLLEFHLGRGSPLSSVQAGHGAERAGSRGTSWSVDALKNVRPRMHVGLGGGYFHSADQVSATFLPDAVTTITSKMTSIFVLGRMDLTPPAKFAPYLVVGLGQVRNTLNASARPDTVWPDSGTSEPRTLLAASQTGVGFAGGGGVDYALNDRLFIGVEARYQGSLKRAYDLTPAGRALIGQSRAETPLNVFLLGVKAGVKY